MSIDVTAIATAAAGLNRRSTSGAPPALGIQLEPHRVGGLGVLDPCLPAHPPGTSSDVLAPSVLNQVWRPKPSAASRCDLLYRAGLLGSPPLQKLAAMAVRSPPLTLGLLRRSHARPEL